MQKSSLQSMWSIGLSRFIGPFNMFNIEKKLFAHLDKIKPPIPQNHQAYYKDKYPLPQIFCDWLAGIISSKELLNLTNTYFNKLLDQHHNVRELRLLRAIARLIFMPEKIAKVIVPIKAGFSLIKQCHQQRAGTHKKHKLFILTNWDAESFALLYHNKKIRKIFDMADDIVVSAHAHMIKPNTALYTYAFEQFGINPDEELTIYIDDELHNINAARSLNKKNLYCIHCKNQNLKKVTQQLVKLGILPS